MTDLELNTLRHALKEMEAQDLIAFGPEGTLAKQGLSDIDVVKLALKLLLASKKSPSAALATLAYSGGGTVQLFFTAFYFMCVRAAVNHEEARRFADEQRKNADV